MADNPQSQEENIDPIQLFTPSVRNLVEGLSYLGKLTEDVRLSGHIFGLQTLRPEHRYVIAQIIQPWRNTLMEVDTWRNAHIAVALTHIDGNYNFCDPIGPRLEDHVRGRFQFISNIETGWYEPTLEYLWLQYQGLELKALRAVEQLNFLSQQNHKPQLWQDLEDISNESESLIEKTNSDTPISPSSSVF